MMPWIVVVCLFMALLEGYFMEVASSSRLPDVYWNSSNPIFRIDNTDHIIDVNRGNNPFDYDQINIICPYSKGTKEEDAETYIIYNVSKEEYESCHINGNNPRIVAVCNKPQTLMYFTITFRSFTPQPGGLEFKPGLDYYFISTSDGSKDGLRNRNGGRCSSHNMKLIFKICCPQTAAAGGGGDTTVNEQNEKNNKIASDHSDASSSSGHTPEVPSSSSAKSSSILLSKMNISTNTINNSVSHLSPSSSSSSSSSSSFDENSRNPALRPINKNSPRNKNNQSNGHHLDQSGHNIRDGNYNNNNNNNHNNNYNTNINYKNFLANSTGIGGGGSNSLMNGGSGGSTTLKPSTDSSIPYWWKPHFKNLPRLKHNNNNNNNPNHNNNNNDQMSNELPRNDQEWTPHRSGSANDKDSDQNKQTESNGWLIVVGASVAVGVACLIVCTLYTCTNYLFFPPRRKEQITK